MGNYWNLQKHCSDWMKLKGQISQGLVLNTRDGNPVEIHVTSMNGCDVVYSSLGYLIQLYSKS